MRITISLFIITCTLLFINVNIIAEHKESILIEEYEEDVTGNGLKEIIKLKGTLLAEESNFYHSVWVEITNQQSKKWQINYGGAYQPKLKFVDVKHENIENLLFQSKTNDDRLSYHSLHSIKNGKVDEIPLPKLNYISGNFKNNFKVDLQISPHEEPIDISVENKADQYVQKNIYNSEGDLLNEKNVIKKSPSHYEPIFISDSKGFGLKSFQPIYGVDHLDWLGNIETVWYFQNNEWIQLQSNWIPSKH